MHFALGLSPRSESSLGTPAASFRGYCIPRRFVMSAELPQLPPFLTQPLACPTNRCNYPGRPLPSISSELERSLCRWFLGRLVSGIDTLATRTGRNMGQKATTMPLLFPLFNWQRTPKYLLQHYIDIFAENASRDLDDSNLSKWFSHVVRNQLPPLVWEMIRRFSSDGRRSCMHDFVDPSQKEVWEELFALPDSRWDSLPDKGTDPQILVDDILSGIARGDFSAGEWGEQDVWERDVLSVFEKYMQLSVDQLVEGGRGVFEGLGYRAVLERPGAILGLVQHFLLADSPSSSDLQAFAADSSQLDQLFHLCQSPTATRITVLNAHRQAPPPYSIPLPAPRSKPTPVSFHRFQKLPNHSIHYPSVVILPPPRFCPPDICSGRRVVKPENYDLVSEKIRSLYRHKMDAISLAQVADRYDTLRMSTLVLLFPLLTSLESTPLIDKQQLLGAIKRAVQDCAGKLEIEIPINRVVMWSLGELARDLLTNQQRQPCLCDLTCMTDGLDRLESEAARVYLEDMEDARQRALQLMTLDTTELQTELEEMIRAGALSGDIWRGDWKRKVDELIRVTAGPMLQQILQRHREFTPLILRLAEILPSARILEEISSYTDDSTRQQSVPFSYQHFDLLVKNKMKAPSSLKTKEIADGKNIRLSKSVDVYQYAAILDPSNHSARLNSAALSQLADHGEQSFQWSRAIYDSSAAIYYGSTSFKAYYRRGYALTHLKLWDKAILDFKEALLIDPGNVLVERCLAAARIRTVVSV